MSVVVIIPVYNRAKTVLEAIESVANQTRPPDRLIVVDDGSSDDIATRFEDWRTARPFAFPVELIHQENRGAGAARNQGIQSALEAHWFAFLDSDDLWPRDFLERTLAALVASPDAIAATCDRRVVDLRKGREKLLDMSKFAVNPTRWMFERGAAVASATLFRAEPICRRNGFNESIMTGQDTELFLRLSRMGRWLHVPGEPVLYRSGLAQSRGESDHLQNHHADYLHQWAQVREDFLRNEGRTLVAKDPCYAVEMARRWRQVANGCLKRRETHVARDHFRRALSWHWSPLTFLRLAGSYLYPAA